jgi:phosphohistidine phosphatase SixA
MKYRTSLLVVILFTLSKTTENVVNEVSTFYFIRHAEKDRSDKTNRNSELTEAGHQRAQKWSDTFKNISFDVVYSTDYNRTQQTAKPTADKNNLEVTSYDPRNIDGKAFITDNIGKTALVVGHSNTTPAFVNAVIAEKKYEDINDSNNANLYIVTIINGIAQSTVLQIN